MPSRYVFWNRILNDEKVTLLAGGEQSGKLDRFSGKFDNIEAELDRPILQL